MIRVLALIAALFCVAPALAQPLPANLDKANAIVIDTSKGRIVIAGRPRARACRAHQAAHARRLL
jgi:peptidylprolyl isomerase